MLLLLAGVHRLNAQDPLKLIQLNHMSWTAREGAPSEIAGLGQTTDGVLWIGSGSGLYRFDGISFSLFRPASGEPPLPGISITTLCVARDGAVWVGFRPAGVAAIRNGHVKLYGVQEGLPPNATYQLLQANDGAMWAIAGLRLWQLRGERWQRESPSEPFSSERVYRMFFDRAGTQWVGTNRSIYRRAADQNEFEATNETGGELLKFAESPDGSLWVGDEEGAGAPIPTVRRLGLRAAGITVDEEGYIPVDDQLRTVVPGIWALGDCNGRGGFTHTAYNDFEIIAANLLDHDSRKVSDRIPVHALYIDPPLAQVGMTEHQVRLRGRAVLIGTRAMTNVSRAIEKGETQGFIKVLVDAESKEILGASILGTGGDEAIHCILTAMYAGKPASLLQRSVHIHPTVAELIPTVLGSMKPLV